MMLGSAKNSFMGVQIEVTNHLPIPGKPKFRLSKTVPVSSEFRQDFDNWAAGIFGREPDIHCLFSAVQGIAYVSRQGYEKLKANSVDRTGRMEVYR